MNAGTAPVLEHDTEPALASGNDDPDLSHWYHCDRNVGWCGIDLSDVEEAPPKTGEVPCPLCELAWESDVCPVCG